MLVALVASGDVARFLGDMAWYFNGGGGGGGGGTWGIAVRLDLNSAAASQEMLLSDPGQAGFA